MPYNMLHSAYVEFLALQVNAWGLHATQMLCPCRPLVDHQLHSVFVPLLAHTTGFSSAQPALMLHTHEAALTGLLHHAS